MKKEESICKKFGHAAKGILAVARTERNMKVHLAAALFAVGLAAYFKLEAWKWAVLFLTIALVMVSEMINTAVEAVVDLHSKTYHPLAQKAKDVAAGAVLLAALWSVIVGAVIFFF
ncbi:MAG: diacylglycerol kinase family protein [Peptococcaceae bacterium]|jgi:diacylglycerol kinase|nr:diacylglycerol kinase family protein [Peptococcaceae bacterium]MDH7524543.1 diacylglycerol kinase family protein [Peptococcaceae bacterium]